MDNILSIIESLASTTKKKEKLAILKEHQDNVLLKRVFKYALDPFYVFYIKAIPEAEDTATSKLSIQPKPEITLSEALSETQALMDRTLTGRAATALVQNLLGNLSAPDAIILTRVLKKDLRCGVSVKTANAVWPKLIFEYPVMLAKRMDEKALKNLSFPCYSQVKMDGMRVNAIVDTEKEKVEYFSRNGKPMDCNTDFMDSDFLEIARNLRTYLPDSKIVLDGELVAKDYSSNTFIARKTSNGICNKAIKGTISSREKVMLHVCLWDVIPFSAFEEGFYDLPYSQRLELLCDEVPEADFITVSVVDTEIIDNEQDAITHGKKMIASGLEGVILKNLDGPWENKRSPNQIKIKEIKTADVRVVGYEEGTGKYEGMIGALLCESANGVQFSVGSGFTDEDRKKPAARYIDNIIEVEYNSIIDRKTDGRKSLFLPIFKEIRLDKNSPDVIK